MFCDCQPINRGECVECGHGELRHYPGGHWNEWRAQCGVCRAMSSPPINPIHDYRPAVTVNCVTIVVPGIREAEQAWPCLQL